MIYEITSARRRRGRRFTATGIWIYTREHAGRDKGAVCKYVRRVLSKSTGEKEADSEGRFTGATGLTLGRGAKVERIGFRRAGTDIDLAVAVSRREGANETAQWN